MYYEERLINGVMCYRTAPNGVWQEYSIKQLSGLYAQIKPTTPHVIEQRLRIAVEALNSIAAFTDELANDRLKETGSYSSFDEPGSVQLARETLEKIDG